MTAGRFIFKNQLLHEHRSYFEETSLVKFREIGVRYNAIRELFIRDFVMAPAERVLPNQLKAIAIPNTVENLSSQV